MGQTTLLAPGTSAAASADIVVPAGLSVTVGLFSAAPDALPLGVAFRVMQDTPGADNLVAKLDSSRRATVLAGPGTYRVTRPAYTGTAVGVFMED